MEKIAKMNTIELAAFVSEYLRKNGVENVLTGGGCATIYSNEKYFSGDLDFVNVNYIPLKIISEILGDLGFVEFNRGYKSEMARQAIDIVKGPITIGEESVTRLNEIRIGDHTLKLLTPTDCVKDRLAAYYHWNDQQSLETALLVCESQKIDLKNVKRWSEKEGMMKKFDSFKSRFDMIKKRKNKLEFQRGKQKRKFPH